MKQSFINFDEKFIKLIQEGRKICTSRLIKFKINASELTAEVEKSIIDKCAWNVGQVVDVTTNGAETPIKVMIDGVSIQRVSEIKDDQSRDEGFLSKEEYLNEIKRIYGEKINFDEEDPFIWFIRFHLFPSN